ARSRVCELQRLSRLVRCGDHRGNGYPSTHRAVAVRADRGQSERARDQVHFSCAVCSWWPRQSGKERGCAARVFDRNGIGSLLPEAEGTSSQDARYLLCIPYTVLFPQGRVTYRRARAPRWRGADCTVPGDEDDHQVCWYLAADALFQLRPM